MRAVVFGTAGHIDHGKTSLVASLTGVDCDRLPEEKRRGITLVLGFAPLSDPAGELEVSFIDVPGHERLVHTMIAGAGGIDRALLVVAADEGVMPQTREHLEVLALLGVQGGVVALNKSDLVDDELLELEREELTELLAASPLCAAPIIACSARSGAGIAELRQALLSCARGVVRRGEPHRPFRLAADRVFSLPGAGTVVTGTARWGSVKAGDELLALPTGRRLRVRGVQVHGGARELATVGERVALRLAGAAVDELPRGEQLLGGGPWRATQRLAITVKLLPGASLAEGDRVWLHLLASRTLARIERAHPELAPGAEGRAILRLARGVFACPGDRVILRRVSPARTLGGGVLLDPRPAPIRRRDAAQLATLPDPLADLPAALGRWIVASGAAGAEVAELASRSGLHEEGLEAALGRLLSSGEALLARTAPRTLVARESVAAVVAAVKQALEVAGNVGMPLAELFSRVLAPAAQTLREFYLGELRRSGVLREVAGRGLAASAAPLADPLAAQIEGFYRQAGFAAPSPEEAATQLRANPKTVEGIVRFLVERKRLARVGGKWILHREVLDEVAESVRAWGVEAFDVGQFKERFGLTRKLAIPVLEWLDSERVTRREGERRRVLPPRADKGSGGRP
ncbi:MAG: selenocysteine-specific translation elongation factor [Acidobacteriota bacterium]